MTPALLQSSEDYFPKFLDHFHRHQLFFLCGAGISSKCGLPTGKIILDRLCKLFLEPKNDGVAREFQTSFGSDYVNTLISRVKAKIQCEVFFERLLWIDDGNETPLQIWRCLDPKEWIRNGYKLKPDLIHSALVDYSLESHIPLITVNFDCLFELEAINRGVGCRVISPTELDAMDTLDLTFEDELTVIKPHGTITGAEEPFSSSNLKICLSQVSKTNFGFIDYLSKMMSEYHLTILGYSGRDIDIYPNLISLSQKTQKRPVWINKFRKQGSIDFNDVAYMNALRLNADIIADYYPDALFRELRVSSSDCENYNNVNEALCQILGNIEQRIKKELPWDDPKRLLLLGSLLVDIGEYEPAFHLLKKLHDAPLDYTQRERAILLCALNSATHNTSRFPKLNTYAKELSNLGKKNEQLLTFQITGESDKAEFKRMRVPFDTFLFDCYDLDLFNEKLCKALEYGITVSKTIERQLAKKDMGKIWPTIKNSSSIDSFSYSWKSIDLIRTQHELIGQDIRRLSTEMLLVFHQIKRRASQGKPVDEMVNFFFEDYKDQINHIELLCKKYGHARGIIYAEKFLSKIILLSQNAKATKTASLENWFNLTKLLNAETNLELNMMEQIKIYMGKMQLNEAENLAEELFYKSVSSGNRMNALKALFAIAECNRLKGKTDFREAFTTANNQRHFADAQRLLNEIDLPLWKEFTRKAKQKFSRHYQNQF
jgi:hypothetical protein